MNKDAKLDWDEPRIDVRKLPKWAMEHLVESYSDTGSYENMSGEERDKIIRDHLTNQTPRDILRQYLLYEGIIGYDVRLIRLINSLFWEARK